MQAKSINLKPFHILILGFLISCVDKTPEVKTSDLPKPQEHSWQEVFRKSYDIPDLKNYKDSAKYIALFIITKRYNNNIIIELSEIANGINLCVKQPVVVSQMTTYDSLRSLPFNQLCYWYADEEAIKIKNLFKKYDNNKVAEEISCKGCLDPETWTVEIYNHGRYSSMTKDAYGEYEPFIDSLFNKVHLKKKNGFRIPAN